MENFKRKLKQFFSGRYGMDQLNLFILILIIVSSILNAVIGSYVFSIVNIVLYVLCFMRFFSRNIVMRSNENRKFLAFFSKIKSGYELQKRKFRDRKTHVYRKCSSCKATVRLPRKRGDHTVKCPKCGERFEVKI